MAGQKQIEETRLDLDHALGELTRASREVLLAQNEVASWRLAAAMSEPLARLELVRRTVVVILQRHHWEPYTASPAAEGPSRPLSGGRKRRSVPSPHRGRARGRAARKSATESGV